jgi:DNA-binding NarL/FixJ family response regulator
MKIRVLLADEHALFREAVKIILDSQPDLQVVAQARDGLEAIAEAGRARPHVAILSADLSPLDVGETTRMIRETLRGCRVLILAVREDLDTLVASFEGGAHGYLTKEDGLDQLVEATRAVTSGETLVPARMLGPLLTRLIHRRKDEDETVSKLSRLTQREREVLVLVMDGANNLRINGRSHSPEAARRRQNIPREMGLHSRWKQSRSPREQVGASSPGHSWVSAGERGGFWSAPFHLIARRPTRDWS